MGIAETGGKTEEDSRESKAGGTARVTKGTDQVTEWREGSRAPADSTEAWAAARRGLRRSGGVGGPGCGFAAARSIVGGALRGVGGGRTGGK